MLDIAAFEAAAREEGLSHTDTWIMPAPALRAGSAGANARSAVQTPPAGGADNGEPLADLEQALQETRKARDAAEERTRALEAELASARAAASAAQKQAAELQRSVQERELVGNRSLRAQDTEFAGQLVAKERALLAARRDLEQAHAVAARYLEALQSVEGWRAVADGIIAGLYHDVDERDVRIAKLEKELTMRGARSRELKSDLRERTARVTKLEKEINRFATALAQRDEKLRELEHSSGELSQIRAALEARNRRIHELESAASQQSASVSERLGELERVKAERLTLAASVESAQAELTAARARAAEQEGIAHKALSRCDELEIALAGARRRADQLEAELLSVRNELQQRGQSLDESSRERSEHVARVAAAEARIQELLERAAEQQDTVRVLQADSNAQVARAKELEADLRAAEDAIHRLEADLRVKNARVEELEKTNQEWRVTMEEARHALSDRENLILRLEEEAANSTVLLGAFRQSITHLDHSAADREPAPDGATRLLIRSDGEREVVHVLGRKTSVGRTPDNDLQIDARFISRHHAVILAGPAHTIIEDLNSTNGVLVNGRRITRQTLRDGDSVVIGRTQFRFAVRQSAERR